MTLDELKATLDTFSPVKIAFVARVMESLANPPNSTIKQRGTWLTSSVEWIEYFGLALSVHHSATTEPLGLTAFEAVFRNACDHLGWPTDPPGSRTRRFVDLTVQPTREPERRLSLKSTAAQRLSNRSLHISKLTEAAWVQDARTARDRKCRTQALFRQYQSAVTHIVMLRAFRESHDEVPSRYQLVEQAEPVGAGALPMLGNCIVDLGPECTTNFVVPEWADLPKVSRQVRNDRGPRILPLHDDNRFQGCVRLELDLRQRKDFCPATTANFAGGGPSLAARSH